MTAFVTAGAGFLLAVLWFDLMFDVQTLRQPPGDLPKPVLTSISTYYARVTPAARPMNRLISLVMLATTVALITQLAGDDAPDWAASASLACALGAIVLAGAHTVPSAVRLGRADDDIAERTRLARTVTRDHLICIAAIVSVLVLQLAFAR